MEPDTAVWTQIKPDTLHRRLSHSSAQVGSYLFISGGHDGSEYSLELLLFNLGKFPCLPELSPRYDILIIVSTKNEIIMQCPYNTSQGRLSVVPPPHEDITSPSSPTHGSSFSAGSTDTTSLTTCTYWTSPRQRISPRSQASALTRSDDTVLTAGRTFKSFLHLVEEIVLLIV